jgi:hypothetical protein
VGILFPMLAPLHFMTELDEVAPAAVLVGISYGGLGYANGNMRPTDHTAPAAYRAAMAWWATGREPAECLQAP